MLERLDDEHVPQGTLDRWNQRAQAGRFKAKPVVTLHPRCKKCGLKIRRPGHEYGPDHIRRAGKKAAVA